TLTGATKIGGDLGTLTISGPIGGGVDLTKDGFGTLTLSGPNTYTGQTSVLAGTLNIQNATALGAVAAGTTVQSGATLQIGTAVNTPVVRFLGAAAVLSSNQSIV